MSAEMWCAVCGTPEPGWPGGWRYLDDIALCPGCKPTVTPLPHGPALPVPVSAAECRPPAPVVDTGSRTAESAAAGSLGMSDERGGGLPATARPTSHDYPTEGPAVDGPDVRGLSQPPRSTRSPESEQQSWDALPERIEGRRQDQRHAPPRAADRVLRAPAGTLSPDAASGVRLASASVPGTAWLPRADPGAHHH